MIQLLLWQHVNPYRDSKHLLNLCSLTVWVEGVAVWGRGFENLCCNVAEAKEGSSLDDELITLLKLVVTGEMLHSDMVLVH